MSAKEGLGWPSLLIGIEAAILAAHDDFAPSHTMPPIVDMAFTTMLPSTSRGCPSIYAIPATAAQPAHVAPQYAERSPMYFLFQQKLPN